MKTLDELKTLRSELEERRKVELYRLEVHNDDRMERIAHIQSTLQAIDDVIDTEMSGIARPRMQRVGRF
ncbi:hypothetical protein [Tateyamaria sp. syn59]|uniref:hypothetical protein n=1 Tax=Tateyamaria sp. syn59 TaxID=2576942 RepID=UPI0011BE9C3F|nr:hypothetical protein [Tateyamaria sp. syn59]